MQYKRELDAALEITRRSGALAMKHFIEGTPAEEKEDGSPVTAADRECERLVNEYLRETFPADGICGEEGAFQETSSGRRWLIDPIDGTRDFVRRTRFWSTMLALQAGSTVVLGVIYFPCLNESYYAAAGQGCCCNGKPIKASAMTQLNRSIVTVSGFPSVWRIWPPAGVRSLTERSWTVRGYGGCYDIAMLARGICEVWLSGNGMEWDYAPARILARESGATFLTRDGSDRIDAGNCVICAPGLESELRRILEIPGQGPPAAPLSHE